MSRLSTWIAIVAVVAAAAGCGDKPGTDSGNGGAGGNNSGAGDGTGGSAAGSGGAGAGGSGAGGAAAGGAGGSSATGGSGGGRGGAGGAAGAGGTAGSPDGGTPDAGRADGAAADARDGGGPTDTGAADARDGGGGDATSTFAPCPTTGACIIMPLGDSITEGYPDFVGGYRVELFHQAVQALKTITFVGRRSNGPNMVDARPFPKGNEGYSGYTINDGGGRTGISGLVDAAITMFRPHIILLAIGTNDINISLDVANAPTRLGALLDRLTTDAPNALVVVAQIVPTTNDTTNARIRTYNAAIPALVQSRVAAGKHLQLVDMYGAFTSNTAYKTAYMVDELHPNPAGYAKMGQTWYAAVSGLLR